MKFDSTILPQTNTPTEIQKMGNDLLDKINQVAAAQANAVTGGPFVPLLPNPLIAGEPSLGTPHPKTGQQTTWFVNGVSPGASTWYTLTFTGLAAGTKAVKVYAVVVCGVTEDHLEWRPYGSSDSYANSYHRRLVGHSPSGFTGAQVEIPVDANGKVDIAVAVAASTIYMGYPQLYDI